MIVETVGTASATDGLLTDGCELCKRGSRRGEGSYSFMAKLRCYMRECGFL